MWTNPPSIPKRAFTAKARNLREDTRKAVVHGAGDAGLERGGAVGLGELQIWAETLCKGPASRSQPGSGSNAGVPAHSLDQDARQRLPAGGSGLKAEGSSLKLGSGRKAEGPRSQSDTGRKTEAANSQPGSGRKAEAACGGQGAWQSLPAHSMDQGARQRVPAPSLDQGARERLPAGLWA